MEDSGRYLASSSGEICLLSPIFYLLNRCYQYDSILAETSTIDVYFLFGVIIQYHFMLLLKLGALPWGSCALMSGTARCSRLSLCISCRHPRNFLTSLVWPVRYFNSLQRSYLFLLRGQERERSISGLLPVGDVTRSPGVSPA